MNFWKHLEIEILYSLKLLLNSLGIINKNIILIYYTCTSTSENFNLQIQSSSQFQNYVNLPYFQKRNISTRS